MKQVLAERLLETLGVEVYPITLVKYLLNRGKIMSYFNTALNSPDRLPMKYEIGPDGCELCEIKKEKGILCRQHTSIHRVINANDLLLDLSTETYLYKNEIFKMVGKYLVIVYCPHPKLIKGDITDAKARKIMPITIEDPKLLKLPDFKTVKDFTSDELMELNIRCWFNRQFSLVTVPNTADHTDWCLVPNQ